MWRAGAGHTFNRFCRHLLSLSKLQEKRIKRRKSTRARGRERDRSTTTVLQKLRNHPSLNKKRKAIRGWSPRLGLCILRAPLRLRRPRVRFLGARVCIRGPPDGLIRHLLQVGATLGDFPELRIELL